MSPIIRKSQDDDLDALQYLTVRAFEPIFASFKNIMGETIFAHVYPDWQKTQRDLVVSMHQDANISTWVAEIDKTPAGLVAIKLDADTKTGEVYFLVVQPDYQQQGIATHLNEFALSTMRDAGMHLAIVGTGGDEGHAPARRAYEKMGYTPVPQVWYCKSLIE